MAKADAIGGFMFRLRELDQPLEHFDERLWLEVIDCVTVCRDGLMFKFQGEGDTGLENEKVNLRGRKPLFFLL